jgi:hypothetical protein
MKFVKALSLLGLVAMTAAIANGFISGNFGVEGSLLLKMPWGVVSLVDLYTGFLLFSGWIIYRERSTLRSAGWVILMMVLGFWTASLYTLIAAFTSQNNWHKFWLGNSYKEG